MTIILCCRVFCLILLCTTSRFTQAQPQSFPGYIDQFPSNYYVISGRSFNAACIVMLTKQVNAEVFFQRRSLSRNTVTRIDNSSKATVTSMTDGDRIIGKVTFHDATFSDTEELTCLASALVNWELVNISQSLTVHSSIAPFVISEFPVGVLKPDLSQPYTLRCVVHVDDHYALEAVTVSILFYKISNEGNPTISYTRGQKTDTNRRTITLDVESKFDGIFECVAKTKFLENAVVQDYTARKTVRISMDSTASDSNQGSDSDDNLLILLCVFSTITFMLLVVFTVLVIVVIWNKKHRSKSYPVSPFPGAIPTSTTNAKSNYYSDSPESTSINKISIQPAVALHITPRITPRLQSISSTETDI